MAERKETDEGRDPFSETEDPALLHVINGWKIVNDKLVIHGHIEAMTVSAKIRRAGLGGDKYDSDEFQSWTRMLPKDLKCDFIMDNPEAAIIEGGDDLAVVGYVLERFARETSLQTYNVMVRHNETVHALKDGAPKKSRVSAGKEVNRQETVDDQLDTL